MKNIFFWPLFIAIASVNARELTPEERLSLIPLSKTLEVKSFMEEKINVRNLSFGEYIRYNILKKSCVPLDELVKRIEREVNTYPDQSKNILTTYGVCSEGTISLTHLYMRQETGPKEDDSTY